MTNFVHGGIGEMLVSSQYKADKFHLQSIVYTKYIHVDEITISVFQDFTLYLHPVALDHDKAHLRDLSTLESPIF